MKYDICVNELRSTEELKIFFHAFRVGRKYMLATLVDSGENA